MKKIAISGIIANYEMESESNVTPATLSKSLEDANGEDLLITINSPGGSVFAGLEMFSLIRNYSGNTETRVVSMAASMGSIIALSGDKRTAERTASYMIHNASSIAWGDHRVMAKTARELEAVSGHLSNIYTDRAGVDNSEVRGMMNEETWKYGEELSEFGFEIVEPEQTVDMATAKFEAHSRYNEFKSNVKPEEFVDDLEKAAASLDMKKVSFTKTEHQAKTETQPPATAGTTQEEATTMNLQELLAANPAAKAEHDNALASARTEGETAGKKVMEEAFTAAMPILASADYPDTVKERVTAKAQKGDVEGLKDFVAIHDMNIEANKQKTDEGEQGDETPPTGQVSDAEKAETDLKAHQARIQAAL